MPLVRIRNDSNHSISIPDVGVYLSGRGSEALVDAATLSKSSDIRQWRHCVSSIPVEIEKPMPVWPFHKPAPPAPLPVPSPPTVPHVQAVENPGTLVEIRDLLKIIASQQFATSMPGSHAFSRPASASAPDAPIFIPGTIVPTNSESKINVKNEKVEKSDFDDAKGALSRLRKR